MTSTNENDEFTRRAKARFDESVAELDAATLSRLNRARQEALAGGARRPLRDWHTWVPATGLVAAVAMVALLVGVQEPRVPVPEPAEADVDVLLGGDNLEMLEEVEFYYWMDEIDAR